MRARTPGELEFEAADPDVHGGLLHDWLHRPHVAPWWPPELSLAETHTYLADQLAQGHLDPWVVSLDGAAFAYVETYRAAEDPLAEAFPLTASDRGWHVLVGPPEVLGTGLPRLLGRAVLARLFAETVQLPAGETRHLRTDEAAPSPVERVVCEPDERNIRMLRFCERLGYTRLATVDLPDKRAALMACTRAEHARRWPADLGAEV